MLYTINDKPYLNLDYFNIDYDRLYQECVAFMMNNPVTAPGSNGGQIHEPGDNPDMYHPEEIELSDEEKTYLGTLRMPQRRLYMKIVKKAYFPWSIYTLNQMREWPERQDHRKRFSDATIKMMPYFVEMIQSLPIFEHVGWARIYGNESFNYVHVHRDWTPGMMLDQFIYFNLTGKTIYLRHFDKDAKLYPEARALYFDAVNLHGTEAEPNFNFSLRVDGKFSRDFRNSLKFSRLDGTDREGHQALRTLLTIRGLDPDIMMGIISK